MTIFGTFTLLRLRLNRAQLVAYRLRKQHQRTETQLLMQHHEVLRMIEQLHEQQVLLLEEHRSLLAQQQEILRLLLRA